MRIYKIEEIHSLKNFCPHLEIRDKDYSNIKYVQGFYCLKIEKSCVGTIEGENISLDDKLDSGAIKECYFRKKK